MTPILLLAAAMAVAPPKVGGGTPSVTPAAAEGVAFEQHLGAAVPTDAAFADESGRDVTLADFLDDRRPVILTLVQYRCRMLCNEVLTGLVEGLARVDPAVGEGFRVVAVSIDAREGPELAAGKRAAYVGQYARADGGGWHFLTGSEASIRRVADAVGFRFRYDPRTDQFAHPAGIVVLTPDGRISRYFYGSVFPPRDLRLGLVEASEGRLGTLTDRVLLLCYHYDPGTGRYTATVMGFVRLGGAVTLLALVTFVAVTALRGGAPPPPAADEREPAAEAGPPSHPPHPGPLPPGERGNIPGSGKEGAP